MLPGISVGGWAGGMLVGLSAAVGKGSFLDGMIREAGDNAA